METVKTEGEAASVQGASSEHSNMIVGSKVKPEASR